MRLVALYKCILPEWVGFRRVPISHAKCCSAGQSRDKPVRQCFRWRCGFSSTDRTLPAASSVNTFPPSCHRQNRRCRRRPVARTYDVTSTDSCTRLVLATSKTLKLHTSTLSLNSISFSFYSCPLLYLLISFCYHNIINTDFHNLARVLIVSCGEHVGRLTR